MEFITTLRSMILGVLIPFCYRHIVLAILGTNIVHLTVPVIHEGISCPGLNPSPHARHLTAFNYFHDDGSRVALAR